MNARTAIVLILTLVAIAIALASPVSASAACSGAGETPSPASVEQAQEAVRCLINKERRDGKNLRQRDTLEAAAQYHATDMAMLGYFSHNAPSGSNSFDRAVASGYLGNGGGGVGEVIGEGYGYSPEAAVRGWMASGAHRRVILSRQFRHIGVGVANVNGDVFYSVSVGFR